jgi:hypothetical protein
VPSRYWAKKGNLSGTYVTFVISFQVPVTFLIKSRFPMGITAMENLLFCLIAQLNLVFGVAGLIWPDKLMPLFGLLMFPWPASYRAIRVNGIVAIGAYLLVLGKLLTVGH